MNKNGEKKKCLRVDIYYLNLNNETKYYMYQNEYNSTTIFCDVSET